MYDITNHLSFINVQKRLAELRQNVEEVKMILIGNKCEQEKCRRVSYNEAAELAEENGMMFLETSALNSENIIEAFEMLITGIITTLTVAHRTNMNLNVTDTNKNPNKNPNKNSEKIPNKNPNKIPNKNFNKKRWCIIL